MINECSWSIRKELVKEVRIGHMMYGQKSS